MANNVFTSRRPSKPTTVPHWRVRHGCTEGWLLVNQGLSQRIRRTSLRGDRSLRGQHGRFRSIFVSNQANTTGGDGSGIEFLVGQAGRKLGFNLFFHLLVVGDFHHIATNWLREVDRFRDDFHRWLGLHCFLHHRARSFAGHRFGSDGSFPVFIRASFLAGHRSRSGWHRLIIHKRIRRTPRHLRRHMLMMHSAIAATAA